MMLSLINSYRSKGLLLDTNLFVLLIIGTIDREKIKDNKRTGAYSPDDFDLLLRFINGFSKIVVTPHILAETSNLADVFNKKLKSLPFEVIKKLLEAGGFEEQQIPALQVCETSGFLRYGLTDSGLVEVARNSYLILTDDLRMANYCYEEQADVINFNHIREIAWAEG